MKKLTALWLSLLLAFGTLTGCAGQIGIIGGEDGPTAIVTSDSASAVSVTEDGQYDSKDEVSAYLSEFNLYDQQGASFDVDEWSKIISDASALIYQFPFHWMAAPSLLKKWQDEVFTFLSKTPAVAGKPLTVVTTTGSEYEAYRSGGRNRFTVDELLRPYQVSAIHSGMSWQTPVVVYGMGTADAGKNIAEGANLYKQRVEMLIGSSNAGNNW